MKFKELEKIKNEFKQNGNDNTKLTFQCFGDGMATYHLILDDGSFHEICVINDTTFFPAMTIYELLEKQPTYVSHRFFTLKIREHLCENLSIFKLADYLEELNDSMEKTIDFLTLATKSGLDTLRKKGLTELEALAIARKKPSPEVLKNFDDFFKKIQDDLSKGDSKK